MRATHQLLNDSLHQGGEGHAVALPVVVNVFDELGDHFRVRLRLKLIAFVDLRKRGKTLFHTCCSSLIKCFEFGNK